MDYFCKGCSKIVNLVQILKHLAGSKNCKSSYSEDEILDFKNQSAARGYARKRKLYDPSKRALKHQEYKAKMEHEKQNSEIMANPQISRNKPLVRQTNSKPKRIKCQSCKYYFDESSILKHISKNVKCKDAYNSSDLKTEFQTIQFNARKRHGSLYYDQIKEKVSERYFLKMKSKESGIDTMSNTKIQCGACKRKLAKKSILNHISHSDNCKEYYSLPPMDKELETIKRDCEKESRLRKKQRRDEKYKSEKDDRISEFISLLKNKAESQNMTGLQSAKKEFELEFKRFRGIKMSPRFYLDIDKLENLMNDTFCMYAQDIERLTKMAEKIVESKRLENVNIQKSLGDVENLFSVILGDVWKTEEHFYTISKNFLYPRLTNF